MSRTPHQDGSAFFEAVHRAIDHGAPLAELSASETFNGAAQHVAVLLADAVDAFRRRSFGTSTFIAITALEEAAKAEVLGFRVRPRLGESKHVRDPMRDHRQKHLIAVRPTTFMGRLPELLGLDTCARLQKEAEVGGLVELRERALYVHADERGVTTPASTITGQRAREILLLALECADDILVGWAESSFELGNRFEVWIGELAGRCASNDERS